MASPLEPGSIVAGEFRIVRLLAEGGMGSVYVVDQIATGKQRALKVMHRSVNDAVQRRRFEQEAKVGALIPSEHVVDVIASGVFGEQETPWLVMELLEGEDLDAHLTRLGSLPVAEAAEILRQLCHGLAAAHAIPVVHRDLKPENVFLAKSRLASARFLVKILDFGIAKIVAQGAGSTQQMGTPMWMAPEQTDLEGRIGPQADVWSLGLVAFRVLTGRDYWRSAQTCLDTAAVLREMLFGALDPASERARELGGVEPPPGFDAWFARCVCRELDTRFATAREAWAALAPVLGAEADLGLRSEPPESLAVPSTPELDKTLVADFVPKAAEEEGSARSTQQGVTSPVVEAPRRRGAWLGLIAVAFVSLVGIGLALSWTPSSPLVTTAAPSSPPSAAPAPVISATATATASVAEAPSATSSAIPDAATIAVPASATGGARTPRPPSTVRRKGTAGAPDFL